MHCENDKVSKQFYYLHSWCSNIFLLLTYLCFIYFVIIYSQAVYIFVVNCSRPGHDQNMTESSCQSSYSRDGEDTFASETFHCLQYVCFFMIQMYAL